MINKLKSNLIEVFVVVGVIVILAGIFLVVIDPNRRFIEARNAQRWSSVNSLLSAFSNYKFDNKGAEPVWLADNTYYMIGAGTDASGCAAQATTAVKDLAPLIGNYITSIPIDPAAGSAAKTLYYIGRNQNGMTVIGACISEKVDGLMPEISVRR